MIDWAWIVIDLLILYVAAGVGYQIGVVVGRREHRK